MADGNLNRELNLLQRQLEQLGATTAEINAIKRAFQDLTGDTSAMSDELERVRNRVKQLRSEAENITTPFADLAKIIQQNAATLSDQNSTLGIAAKAQNKVASISRDMVNDYQGLADLSQTQLQSKLDDLVAAQSQLSIQSKIAKEEAKILQYTIGKSKAEIKRMKQLREVSKFNAEEDAGLTGLIAKTKDRLELETSINENMGVAGSLIGGTGALMERLGMRSGIFKQTMDKATSDMRIMAKDMGKNVTFMNKLKLAATGVSRVLEGFGEALFDPSSIGLKLLDTFFKINQQSVEISRLTGQSASNFDTFFNGAASARDQMEVVAELTKQTGLNAQNAFSKQNLQGAANLKVEMGLAAGEAGNLAIMAQTSGQNVEDLTDNLVSTVSEFNGANRAAVSQGQVLRDIGNVSEGIRASFAGNTQALVKGAAAARQLGMEIGELDNIAKSLLDFESSIESELEAQLLTGKNINMAKARELALSNDLEGLGKELLKNSSDIHEFGKMNRIQQEAQAKALGMTRDQLARVAYQRALNLGMSEEEAANAASVEAEDMKRITAQENFAKAIEKIAAALAPILDFVGDILSIPLAPYFILGAGAAIKLGTSLTGIATKMGSIVGKTQEFIKSLNSKGIKNFFSKIGGAFKAGKSQDTTKKVSDKISDASKSTKGIKPGAGDGPKNFLKGLGEGLKGMAGSKVLQGALNLIPASIGLTAMIPGVAGAKLMELINGVKLQENLYGLAYGLEAMGKGKTMLGALGLLIASAGFVAMIPGSIGMGLIAALGGPAAAALVELAIGLELFGAAISTGVGAIGLASFIGLAVGLGAAFALVGAGAMMFGKGIEFAANGVTKIFTGLTGLISSIPQLYLLGGALMSIAAGLGAIAFAGIAAIPALAALSGFALAATPLIAISGLFGGEGGDEDGFARLESKLDTLINVISEGGDVYLDSDKVGSTQAKSFSKLSL